MTSRIRPISVPEVAVHLCVMVWMQLWLIYEAAALSSPSAANHTKFEHLLSRSPLTGRVWDNSDAQYRGFRDKLAILVLLGVAHVSLGRLVWRRVGVDARVVAVGELAFSAIVMLVLHGFGAVKMVLTLTVGYFVARRAPWWGVWVYGVGWLLVLGIYGGWQFGWLHPMFSGLDELPKGMMSRWWMSFNFQVLRMISFGMDWHWFLSRKRVRDRETCPDCPAFSLSQMPCYKCRVEVHRPPEEYNFVNFLSYCLFTPLYFAGPIVSFNDYVAQTGSYSPTFSRQNVSYLLRWIFVFICMESMQHVCFTTAIAKAKAWNDLTPFQFMVVGFINLIFIWLKLTVIWRFFRLWSLLAGVEAPENMERCIVNNYSAQGFWRAWHRSYNRWIIRYIYVPMEGGRRKVVNSVVTFTFVALWHDVSLDLLVWGWGIVLFILPEIILTAIFTKPEWREWPWHRALTSFGGAANILLMIYLNLIGFSVGVEGLQSMMAAYLSWKGVVFFAMAFPVLMCCVNVQFFIRESEIRSGKKERY